MQAKEGILDILNNLLTLELTAVNQYFLQAEMCKNWGLEGLYEHLFHISRDEMNDAQHIVRHILYLEGVPNLQRLNRVQIGENVLEHLRLDLQAEKDVVAFLNQSIVHCAQVGDYTTRGMLESSVASEEEHVDWLETQLAAIELIGIENYLAQHLDS
jgi:bacterioferritin